jgi:anthranilate phosphoribosyltransferase
MSILPDVTAPLTEAAAEAAFGTLLDGAPPESEIEAFLVALSARGETSDEIAGAARALRARMIPIASPEGAIDVCGTGGDGHHTLNVSTAVSLVVAAVGVPVAKHGNRAASSKAGAADTLEALGLDMDAAGRTAEKTLAEIGICFLFAQAHHPALARIAPIRKRIGHRTIFNLLGPLANPARVTRQLIGIAQPALIPAYVSALRQLGTAGAMVVSGAEGLDEISISDVTHVAAFDLAWDHDLVAPEGVGLPRHPLAALRGGDPAFNAAALRALLGGEPGAYRDAVLFNAAAALIVAGTVSEGEDGIALAAEALDSGAALALLHKWIELAK